MSRKYKYRAGTQDRPYVVEGYMEGTVLLRTAEPHDKFEGFYQGSDGLFHATTSEFRSEERPPLGTVFYVTCCVWEDAPLSGYFDVVKPSPGMLNNEV